MPKRWINFFSYQYCFKSYILYNIDIIFAYTGCFLHHRTQCCPRWRPVLLRVSNCQRTTPVSHFLSSVFLFKAPTMRICDKLQLSHLIHPEINLIADHIFHTEKDLLSQNDKLVSCEVVECLFL